MGAMLRALFAGLLFLSPAAWATTLLRAGVPELTRVSDAIVRGRVLEQKSHWTGDGRQIVTDVQIQVDQALKGAPGQWVTVRQPGGQVGDIGQRVSGLATFRTGEEVVVFLQKRGPVHVVAGLAQGKFHLDRLQDGSVRATPDSTAGAEVIDPRSHQKVTPARSPVALGQLEAEIQKALQPAGAR